MPDDELNDSSAEKAETAAPAEGSQTAASADVPVVPVDDSQTTAQDVPTQVVADSVLLAAVDAARDALLEITPASSVGAPVGHTVEGEHVLSLLFECTLTGYPGWRWTVTMSRIDDESAPSVLETELMPGEHALLAPDWIPWSERLAEYQASQEALRIAGVEADLGDDGLGDDELGDELDEDDEDDDDEDEDDEDEDDEDDLDDDADNLHDADIDGVDIDFEADEDLETDELAAFDGQEDESDDPESDSDDGGPYPPDDVVRDEIVEEDEQRR